MTLRCRCWLALFAVIVARSGVVHAQQGVVLSGIGPINQSMGGASVAAPLDALGAVHWNPATMDGLPHSQMDFALTLLYPQSRLTTTVNPGVFAPFVFSNFPLQGSTPMDAKVAPLASFALTYRPDDSPWTLGIGVIQIAGSELNYPADPNNLILSPPPPNGFGLGPLTTTIDVLQFSAALSCKVTDHLSVGMAATPDLGLIVAEPALFAPVDNAGGGFPSFSSASRPEFTWGFGLQGGAYYTTDIGWNFGASVNSPNWFEPFQYHATDKIGRPRLLTLRLDLPTIASVGTAYTGLERWTLALDARYIDYKHARGFGPSGFEKGAMAAGLGWDSIFVVALGAQYQMNDRLSLRAGYAFNQNPISPAVAAFNAASPAVIQHSLSVGASYKISGALTLALAYSHNFDNSVSGPLVTPFGTFPFIRIKDQASADYLLFGLTVDF
jgi:long-chain fatty acid transport protein